MATRFYPAIVEPAQEGFGVYFPDLPGCTSAGDTFQEAAQNAARALALHLAGMAEDGDKIPNASAPDTVEVPPRCHLIYVQADVPGRNVRINITMDEGTLALADRLASARGTTRSGLLAELVRQAASAPDPVRAMLHPAGPSGVDPMAFAKWFASLGAVPSLARLPSIHSGLDRIADMIKEAERSKLTQAQDHYIALLHGTAANVEQLRDVIAQAVREAEAAYTPKIEPYAAGLGETAERGQKR